MTVAMTGMARPRPSVAPPDETEKGRIDPFILTVTIVNLSLAAAMLAGIVAFLIG